MKKILILFIGLIMSFSCFCQEVHFKVFQCSYRESSWSSWTPWNTCNADLTIDLGKNQVVISGQETQVYQVCSYDEELDFGGERFIQISIQDNGKIQIKRDDSGDFRIMLEIPDKVEKLYKAKKEEKN